MGLGRKKEDDDPEAVGRFVVEDMPIAVSGKRTLQRKLDAGDAAGWTLRSLLVSDKHDYILIVWDRSGS